MMQLARWGNSLAVRLPVAVVQALNLKEGDDLEIKVAGERGLSMQRKMTRAEAVEAIRKMRKPLPEDFKFNREELYDRDFGSEEVR